jgi:hypothetical protein
MFNSNPHLIDQLTQWIDHPKKVATSLALGNSKSMTYYLGPILDVLLRKWFPLSIAPSSSIIT